jgi:hypothetical protein
MAGGGESGEAGHQAAGDETEGHGGREAGEFAEPGAGDGFDDGDERGVREDRAVLIVGGDEPVCGKCGGEAAADDEAEIARARGGDGAVLGGAGEGVDYVVRVCGLLREWAAEKFVELRGGKCCADGARGERGEPGGGVAMGGGEEVVHAESLGVKRWGSDGQIGRGNWKIENRKWANLVGLTNQGLRHPALDSETSGLRQLSGVLTKAAGLSDS